VKAEIKERIEQVRRGEVPEGYRRTKDIGIAPYDWAIGQMSDVLHNEQRPVPKPTEAYWRIRIRSHAKGAFHELVKNPDEVNMEELYAVKSNDLIVNITFAWEHAVALAKKADEGLLVSHRFPTYVFNNGNCPEFYKAVITQGFFKNMLGYISPGGAGRNRVMSKPAFLKLPCYIPPTKEQERIAEILTHCDKVIELKKQLIEEKCRQKKWLMQKIFNNKERVERLEAFAEVLMGQSPGSNTYNSNQEGLPLIQGNADINGRLPEPRQYTTAPTKTCNQEDLLLSVRAPVGHVSKSTMKACIGRGMCAIRPKKHTEYIYQFLLFFEEKWIRVSQGSTFDAICGDDIRKLEVPLYSNNIIWRIEQLLSYSDQEIDLLEQELAQWHAKKKSLMQLLLTGLVRVKI
jgi:type I restriction enzyme S subunit